MTADELLAIHNRRMAQATDPQHALDLLRRSLAQALAESKRGEQR